ncbi:hypothetical protein AAES_40795 [Amazona aestiva]|uniref:Uncharacterized protein n=1 Tax=Amazona aestiva TaxID=12930 RepID=A0A0Q3UU48_AMAAE|nr:hypothetical protein AAES_40795 [Amazona aestiva]
MKPSAHYLSEAKSKAGLLTCSLSTRNTATWEQQQFSVDSLELIGQGSKSIEKQKEEMIYNSKNKMLKLPNNFKTYFDTCPCQVVQVT